MTEVEAIAFIDEVFVGHWANWKFGDAEVRVWCKVLRQYDFTKARDAIDEVYMSQTKQGKPPAGVIRAALRSKAMTSSSTSTEDKEKRAKAIAPTILYEIVKPGNKSGYRVGTSNLSNVQGREQEVVDEAARTCKDLHGYNGELNVQYKWDALRHDAPVAKPTYPDDDVDPSEYNRFLDNVEGLCDAEREAATQ